MTSKEMGELDSKDFHGADVWKAIKADYDSMLAFRNGLRGKPDEYDRALLDLDKPFIEHLGFKLWHSAALARDGRCGCPRCKRKA